MTSSSESGTHSVGPLLGVRVLEIGQLIAGPFAGQILADLGAEVIKVEPATGGDPLRQWGQVMPKGESLWWSVIGRNKKSVALDVRTVEGRDIVLNLADHCDILIENFRPGRMERWGLGYDVLSARNRGIVMVRVSGFGQDGPYSERAGFGAIGEAMGGLRYVVGDPRLPSSRTGIAIGDAMAGALGAIGALSALIERQSSGRGQVVDVAIYEAVLSFMESLVTEFDVAGFVRERTGATLPGVAPSNVYRTKDGEVLIAANQDSVFRRLAEAMGRPELAENPRYRSHTDRGSRQAELDRLVGEWTQAKQTDQLLETLAEAGVPAGLIYRAPDMLKDPHFKFREAITRVNHKIFGSIAMQNVFPKFSRTPGRVRWVGPELGEHTEEVLTDLGQTAGEPAQRIATP